jgi:hypothetical protein
VEQVLGLIKKVDTTGTTVKVHPVPKVSMIGVEKIDLEMEGNLKKVECLMEIQS